MGQSPNPHHGFPHVIFAIFVTMFLLAMYAAVIGTRSAEADDTGLTYEP